MTRKEAIGHIKDVICENNTIKPSIVVFEQEKEALYMAIKALEQEEPTYYPPCIDCNKKMDEIRCAYDKLNEQEPKWIPVSERLPEKPGDYLVTIKEKPFECPKRNFVCECHYCGNRLWNMPITFVVFEEQEVISWMPLPDPYKPKESEVKHEKADTIL